MIYLDSAATTFQKPLSVSYAMQRAMRTMSSPGRGGYAAARAAEETAFRCRSLAAELFGVPSPEQVVFASNATHALNIAIRSLVPEGGRDRRLPAMSTTPVTRPLPRAGREDQGRRFAALCTAPRCCAPLKTASRRSLTPSSARTSPMCSASFCRSRRSLRSAARREFP